ncbi:MAG: sugar ABC transporter permease [Clostridiales bacterium]|nr:sugar ABC transporter permease [Clostridiales bacterium]MBD9010435.1 sugar ABC transporter permease [Clostridiales bacterium]
MKKYRSLYWLMLPGILYFLIFSYGPMYGITIAFKDYWMNMGILKSPWIGLDNFRRLLAAPKFYEVFSNTLIISLEKIVCGFPVPIILALLLNEIYSTKLKRVLQTVMYLPHFISWVVISGIIFILFSQNGPVNNLLEVMHIGKVNFLTNPSTFRPMIIVSDIWKECGWGTIIYLASITGISPEYYEAAMIDGASRFQQITKITLPCILPTVVVMLVLRVGGITNAGFDQIFNLYNEAVYKTGDIIQTYNYRIGLADGDYSMGTAVGLLLNIINCALMLATNYISNKLTGMGLY